MIEDFDDIENKKQVLAEQDLSDEDQIKVAMLGFYNVASLSTPDNIQTNIHMMRAKRNVIKNMMEIYLSKFNNQPIMDDYQKAIDKAMKDSIKDGKLYYYSQFMKEMVVIGTFLGIRENIGEKMAKELLGSMVKEGAIVTKKGGK